MNWGERQDGSPLIVVEICARIEPPCPRAAQKRTLESGVVATGRLESRTFVYYRTSGESSFTYPSIDFYRPSRPFYCTLRSSLHDLLPPPTRRALEKLGRDVSAARRKRHLTVAMMAERMGVAVNTYRRVERGDATVAMGAYAMALFVLGFGEGVGDLIDARRDDVGLQLDEARLPKRVRVKHSPTAL